jgi:hypothetical protein
MSKLKKLKASKLSNLSARATDGMNGGQHQKPRMQFRKCERTIPLTDPYQLAPRRTARFSESHDVRRDSNDTRILVETSHPLWSVPTS